MARWPRPCSFLSLQGTGLSCSDSRNTVRGHCPSTQNLDLLTHRQISAIFQLSGHFWLTFLSQIPRKSMCKPLFTKPWLQFLL